MKIFLTGASGFVGSHVLRHLLINTDSNIVCPVTFRHKGIPPRLWNSLEGNSSFRERVLIVPGLDLTSPIDRVTRKMIGDVDFIMNVASESHVDRSIDEPGSFIRNNVGLITNLLDYAREIKPRMFLQMSTDEVYGPAYADHRHREWEAIRPSNPYSASKAAQEAVCFSYWRTYGVPVVLTNTMNIIGEMQDPEKFVPKIIRSILNGSPVKVHTDAHGNPGSRFYLHARNLADAWLFLMNNHTPQMYPDYRALSRFHIVGDKEVSNKEMVHLIEKTMGRKADIVSENFHKSRPGHDHRYALDGSKIDNLGWKAPVSFEESLNRTVSWCLENTEWLV